MRRSPNISPQQTIRQRVISLLRQYPDEGLHYTVIAKRLHLTAAHANQACWHLVQQERLVRTGEGMYAAIGPGKAWQAQATLQRKGL